MVAGVQKIHVLHQEIQELRDFLTELTESTHELNILLSNSPGYSNTLLLQHIYLFVKKVQIH